MHIEDAIHQSYARIRAHGSLTTPMVLLHIGEEKTGVAAYAGVETGANTNIAPAQVRMLEIGAARTSRDWFKHNPPAPIEIENAILVVEDEVTRARGMVHESIPLYSTDERLFEMARLAGDPQALSHTLHIDQVEGLFNQLAARAEGRPSSQVAVPDDPRWAATLLIVREFMHHLPCEVIHLR